MARLSPSRNEGAIVRGKGKSRAGILVASLVLVARVHSLANSGACYVDAPLYRFDAPVTRMEALAPPVEEAPVFEVIPLMETPAPQEAPEHPALDQRMPSPAEPAAAAPPSDGGAGPLAPVEPDGDGFDGIYNANNIPPDTMGCAGPEDILNVINVHMGVFGKDGSAKQAKTSFTSFFSGLGMVDNKYFDPICIYDHLEKQFVMIAMNKSSDYKQSYLGIAVSSNSSAMSGWHKYGFNAQTSGGADTNYWADYPGIGYDTNALYFTANMFERIGGSSYFRYAKLYAFKKSDLYYGSTNVTRTDIFPIQTSYGASAATVKPAVNLGLPSRQYLASCYYYALISVWQVNDIFGGSPSLTAYDFSNGHGSEYSPADARQKDSNILLDTVGFRIMHPVVWRDDSLWFAHTVSPVSGGDYARIRWRELNATGAVSTVTQNQTGLITNAGPINTYHYFPAIAVDGETNAVINYSRSSTNEYAGAWFSSREASLASGTMTTNRLMKAGEAYYDCPWYGGNPERWGDYAANAIDPLDDTFWTFSEYARSDHRYDIWIQNIRPQDRAYLDVGTSNFTSGAQGVVKLRNASTLASTSCVVQSITITNGSTVLPPWTNSALSYLATNCAPSSVRFAPQHIGDNLQGENVGSGRVSGTIGLMSTNYTSGHFRCFSGSSITASAYYADSVLVSIPTDGRGTNDSSTTIVSNVNPAYVIPGFAVEWPTNNHTQSEFGFSMSTTGTVGTGTANNDLADNVVSVRWSNATVGSNGWLTVNSGVWNGVIALSGTSSVPVTNVITFYAQGQSSRPELPASDISVINVVNPATPPTNWLIVTSEYGNSDPPQGTNLFSFGADITCSITNSPAEFTDSVSWKSCICTGWVGTGSVPAGGSTTNTGSFALNENSSITWLWAVQDLVLSNQVENATTNYTILGTITARDGYNVETPGDVTFEAGEVIKLEPGFTARTGSHFRAMIDEGL